MEITLIDGMKAEAWIYPAESYCSPFRVRIIRRGFIIGSGNSITAAVNDVNTRLSIMAKREAD